MGRVWCLEMLSRSGRQTPYTLCESFLRAVATDSMATLNTSLMPYGSSHTSIYSVDSLQVFVHPHQPEEGDQWATDFANLGSLSEITTKFG